MMTQVSGVVNDTLISAEGWCDKIGRRKTPGSQPLQQQQQQQQHLKQQHGKKECDEQGRSVTLGSEQDNDVKMEL